MKTTAIEVRLYYKDFMKSYIPPKEKKRKKSLKNKIFIFKTENINKLTITEFEYFT